MALATTKLTQAVEAYFTGLQLIKASGGATGERSSYGPLGNLLNAVGDGLRPKVFCVQELADQGAGHPDFGLYTTRQAQQGKPRPGQQPERGVIEVKPAGDDAWLTAESGQVSRYWQRYRQVIVTNTRDFVLFARLYSRWLLPIMELQSLRHPGRSPWMGSVVSSGHRNDPN